jgi:Icc-related predicted phosphoesterase
MRFVFASDTHFLHNNVIVPDGDVFVHCGDFTKTGTLEEVAAFGLWLRKLPHTHKIIITGNRDRAFRDDPLQARLALGDGNNGIVYLQDRRITIADIRIYGAPWLPQFGHRPFDLSRTDLVQKWQEIPLDTDIVITHGPPQTILDNVHGEAAGCADLLARIKIVKPQIHAFGHIHQGAGTQIHNETTFINAAICNANYQTTNPCRIFDLAALQTQTANLPNAA